MRGPTARRPRDLRLPHADLHCPYVPACTFQVATSVDLDDFHIPTSERFARTAVIAYTGTFYSGMPFQVGRRRRWAGPGSRM